MILNKLPSDPFDYILSSRLNIVCVCVCASCAVLSIWVLCFCCLLLLLAWYLWSQSQAQNLSILNSVCMRLAITFVTVYGFIILLLAILKLLTISSEICHAYRLTLFISFITLMFYACRFSSHSWSKWLFFRLLTGTEQCVCMNTLANLSRASVCGEAKEF